MSVAVSVASFAAGVTVGAAAQAAAVPPYAPAMVYAPPPRVSVYYPEPPVICVRPATVHPAAAPVWHVGRPPYKKGRHHPGKGHKKCR